MTVLFICGNLTILQFVCLSRLRKESLKFVLFTLCFLNPGKASYSVVRNVSTAANSVSNPNRKIIKKNSMDHNHGRGKSAKASGYVTNANPVPASATLSISSPLYLNIIDCQMQSFTFKMRVVCYYF